jgi:hypothetical protein
MAVIVSAMHQWQAIVLSAIVFGSPQLVPKPVPKPVAKRAAQGVLRTARRLNKAAAAARRHFVKSRWS